VYKIRNKIYTVRAGIDINEDHNLYIKATWYNSVQQLSIVKAF
jgi:hypothetical protein